MKSLFSLLTVLCIVSIAVCAFAVDLIPALVAAEPTAGLGTLLQQTVFPVIAAFLLGLISLALKWVARKFKLDALAQEDSFLLNLAHQGITLAEERGAQLIDSKIPLTGQNKLAIATGHVLSVIRTADYKYMGICWGQFRWPISPAGQYIGGNWAVYN